jgi:hypothetical protein
MVACSASIIVALFLAIGKAVVASTEPESSLQRLFPRSFLADYSFALQEMAPYVVATAWLMLALSGRWRSEPSWIDRLGRIIGVFWVGLLPLSWIANAVIGNGLE